MMSHDKIRKCKCSLFASLTCKDCQHEFQQVNFKNRMTLNQDTINRKGIQKHNKQIGQGSLCDISVEAEELLRASKTFGVRPRV